MLKYFRIFFMIILSLSLSFPLYSFSGGDGSLGSPYQVSDCIDLQNITNYLTSNFTQISDIDCNVVPYNTGTGFLPIGSPAGQFSGKYNGSDYIISNLYINSSVSDVGLFYNIFNSGGIYNLKLENVDITNNNNSVSASTGGITGSDNTGKIFNSYVKGNINGNNKVGGLVGEDLSFSTINNSFFEGQIQGVSYLGGLVGYGYQTIMDNSYVVGDIIATGNMTGGLIGSNYGGMASNSYVKGSVVGDDKIGGLVGQTLSTGGKYTNLFYLPTTFSGSGTSVGVLFGHDTDFDPTKHKNVSWNNISGLPTKVLGFGGTISNPVVVQNDESYFYNSSNLPMSNWDLNNWNFTGSSLPFHSWDSQVVVTPPTSGVSVSSLPSLGVWSGFISVVLVGFFFLI